MRYRIKRVGRKFIAQVKGWFFWHDMFTGDTGIPTEFTTSEETERKILEAHDTWAVYSTGLGPVIVKEFELPATSFDGRSAGKDQDLKT